MHTFSIAEKVWPRSTDVFRAKFHTPGVIDKISFRFYPGQMLGLKIEARIKRIGGSYISLFGQFYQTTNTDNRLTGDDDYFVDNPGIEVRRGDELELLVENVVEVPEGENDEDYVYDFQCYCTVREKRDDR